MKCVNHQCDNDQDMIDVHTCSHCFMKWYLERELNE